MDREVSLTVEISVALVAICAVISIIWFTVYLGNDVANQSSETASDIVATMESTVLEELVGEDEVIMPSAAIYNVLKTYGNAVPELYCEICGGDAVDLTTSNPCVIKHLSGKVHVLVLHRTYGGYRVIVSDSKIDKDNYID